MVAKQTIGKVINNERRPRSGMTNQSLWNGGRSLQQIPTHRRVTEIIIIINELKCLLFAHTKNLVSCFYLYLYTESQFSFAN